jgi:hypothetical protein
MSLGLEESGVLLVICLFDYDFYLDLFVLSQDCERYKLGDMKSFHYLNQSDCYELNNVSNGREYVKTRRAMDVVGINPDDQVIRRSCWHCFKTNLGAIYL